MLLRKLTFRKVVCLSVTRVVSSKTHTCVLGFQVRHTDHSPPVRRRYVRQPQPSSSSAAANSPSTWSSGCFREWVETQWFLQQFNAEQGQVDRKQVSWVTNIFELFIDYIFCKSTVPKAHTGFLTNFRKHQGC